MNNQKISTTFVVKIFVIVLIFVSSITFLYLLQLRTTNKSIPETTSKYTIIHKTCSGKLQNTYKGSSNIEPIGNGFKLTKNNGLETMIFGGLTIMNEEDSNITPTTVNVDEGNK